MQSIRLISWNVNGIRSHFDKGFFGWLGKDNPDILCIQETKARKDQLTFEFLYPSEYETHWSACERPGYSGVAVFCKEKPRFVRSAWGIDEFDREGRVLEISFTRFDLWNVYFPNGQSGKDRADYKIRFHDALTARVRERRRSEPPLIICGDFNIAHHPIDLARPDDFSDVSGFLPNERRRFDALLEAGYSDSFRWLHPETVAYTWWDLRTRGRLRNDGWRLDYFVIQDSLKPYLKAAYILSDMEGSDHCPVGLDLSFPV